MKSSNKYFKFLIFILLVFAFSCTKKEKTEDIKNTESLIESEQTNANTLVFGETRDNTSSNLKNQDNEKGFSEIDKGDIKGQLLPISSIKIVPEDMVIGKLLDFSSMDVSIDSFPNAVLTFFSDAKKGIINKDVLHPFWENSIEKLFINSISNRNYSIRIGEIYTNAGINSANIRLISNIGRSSGDVLGDSFEGKWLLSNVSIDLTQLDDVYLSENIEFNPLSYTNLLLNY